MWAWSGKSLCLFGSHGSFLLMLRDTGSHCLLVSHCLMVQLLMSSKDTHVHTHMHSRLHLALCSVEFLMEMWSVAVTFWFVQDPQGSSSLSNLTDHFLCRSAHSSSTSEGTVSIYLFLYVMSVKMSFGLSSYRFVRIHWPDVHNPYWIWHITTCDIISHGVLSITESVFILYALVLRFQSSSYHSRSCT